MFTGFTVEKGSKRVTNIPVGERTGALFGKAAASVPESGFKQLVKTAGMEGGMRQLGSEFADAMSLQDKRTIQKIFQNKLNHQMLKHSFATRIFNR